MSNKRSFQSAKEVMTKKLVFVDGMATAKEAVDLMRSEKVEALIVSKRDPQDAFGIVVIHDFIDGVILPDKSSEEVHVYELMTKPVLSIPANMDARYVAHLLMKVGFRMAPVQEEGTFIGMVSLSDIILDNLSF